MNNFLKNIEEKGTLLEKNVWLKFKDRFQFFTYKESDNNEYKVYDIIKRNITPESEYNFILQNDLFTKNLLFHYEQSELKFCKENIKINSKPRQYCDQEFAVYRFEKEEYKLFNIMEKFFLEYGLYLMEYKYYIETKNKIKKMSKNILNMFMKDFNDNIITNKNGEFEEFHDIIILEDDGNNYNIICENSDYYYFFKWCGS